MYILYEFLSTEMKVFVEARAVMYSVKSYAKKKEFHGFHSPQKKKY